MIRRVEISQQAANQLEQLPQHIVRNLILWVAAVELEGLEAVQTTPSFCDKAAVGERSRPRTIRLSRKYKALCAVRSSGSGKLVSVESIDA